MGWRKAEAIIVGALIISIRLWGFRTIVTEYIIPQTLFQLLRPLYYWQEAGGFAKRKRRLGDQVPRAAGNTAGVELFLPIAAGL